MAEKTLVDQNSKFFELLQNVSEELHKKHGPLYLAAVLQFTGEPSDEWVYLVGSSELASNLRTGISRVIDFLSQLPSEYGKMIKRIGVLEPKDPFLPRFVSALSTGPIGLTIVRRCVFNGIAIEDGAVFAAQLPTDESRDQLNGPTASPE